MNLIKSNYTKATIIGQLGLLMWGLLAVFTVVVTNIPTFEILSIVFTVSFITGIAYSYIKGEENPIKKHPKYMWFIGFLGIFCNDALYIQSFKYAPPEQADLINYLWPLMVILFSSVLPKEKFLIKYVISAVIAFTGIYLLLCGGEGFHYEFLPGYGFAFLAASCWAIFTLFSRGNNQNKSIAVTAIYCGIAAVGSFVSHCVSEVFIMPTLSQSIILVIMGVTTHSLAYIFWDFGIKKGNFRLLSILSYANPIISIFFLVLLGFAPYSNNLLIAAVLVFIAGVISAIDWESISEKALGKLFSAESFFKSK